MDAVHTLQHLAATTSPSADCKLVVDVFSKYRCVVGRSQEKEMIYETITREGLRMRVPMYELELELEMTAVMYE